MLCSSVVAFDSPTEPNVIDVGHVEFTVLPVPLAAPVPADPEEPALEQPATTAIATAVTAARRAHLGVRSLRNVISLPAGLPGLSGPAGHFVHLA
jgi:hypothetical protein